MQSTPRNRFILRCVIAIYQDLYGLTPITYLNTTLQCFLDARWRSIFFQSLLKALLSVWECLTQQSYIPDVAGWHQLTELFRTDR